MALPTDIWIFRSVLTSFSWCGRLWCVSLSAKRFKSESLWKQWRFDRQFVHDGETDAGTHRAIDAVHQSCAGSWIGSPRFVRLREIFQFHVSRSLFMFRWYVAGYKIPTIENLGATLVGTSHQQEKATVYILLEVTIRRPFLLYKYQICI